MDREDFLSALRTALMQLDDLQSLRRNSLLPLLSGRGNPVEFQQCLLAAIESLQAHPLASTTQAYEILHFRFVEQMSQKDVAYQLGVSVRTLRRDQFNAIELLAELLWRDVESSVDSRGGLAVASGDTTPVDAGAVYDEIAWLRSETLTEVSLPYKEIANALQDAAIVAEHHHVSLDVDVRPDESGAESLLVPMPAQILHQALSAALTSAIVQVSDQTLHIALQRTADDLHVSISQENGESPSAATAQAMDAPIQKLAQMLAPFGGEVLLDAAGWFSLTLVLPTVATVPVLLIDDNPDVRQLLQRYVERSRFRLIATDDVERGILLAYQHQVKALILDIMMPDHSGWDLLAQWRHHPETQDIPVIVSTILPQEELAKLMGAATFLPKPVTREDLLATLSALTASSGPARG